MLKLVNFTVYLDKIRIVDTVNFSLKAGELVALMGPNGSGKSTLASSIMAHPFYRVDPQSKLFIDDVDVSSASADERSRAGIFLAFQNPVSIPGVSLTKLLREMGHFKEGAGPQMTKLRLYASELSFNEGLLIRGLNDGFSGGEKKKVEMVQALFFATKYAIFDEIDTGLDIDALKKIASRINELKAKGIGVLVITHYQRLVELLNVDRVIIMKKGKVIKEGGRDVVARIEKEGYDSIK